MQNKNLINGSEAIREAFLEAAKIDKNVLFFGEGISDPSSFYGTTKDLDKIIGKKRLIEMPLSENAMLGAAVGASMFGKRVIINMHRVEFALLAIEQLVNNAAKSHYISAGIHRVPIVLRLIVGRGWGQGPEHSQSLENMFSIFPGLKVIIPSLPNSAKQLMIDSIFDNNPIVFIEHRWIHYASEIRKKSKKNHFKPLKIINGKDITIVTSSIYIMECIILAKELKKYGIYVELFDLRVSRPLYLNDINKSVKKTGKLITIDLGNKNFGIGSEIISEISSSNFSYFKSSPTKIGMPNYPTPSSRGYLKGHYPDKKFILEKIMNYFPNLIKHKDNILKNITKSDNLPIDVPNEEFKGPF